MPNTMQNSQYRILVVDDLPDWRKTLKGLLEDKGYEVWVAGSSDMALRILESDHFDIAVLDVRLDETDESNTEGLSLAAKIKKNWSTVKVVIVTGYGTQDTMREVMEPDAKGESLAVNYLPKEETENLVEIVEEVLDQ